MEEDHITFLKSLLAYDRLVDPAHPTILVRDFNQTIPPNRAPEEACRLLLGCYRTFSTSSNWLRLSMLST